MDLKLIRNLVRLMERGELTELEIDDERAGLRLHLKRGQEGGGGQPGPVVMVPGAAAAPAQTPAPAQVGEAPAPAPAMDGVIEVPSPMVGTFYRSANPESEPFVSKGTRIDEESTICIIEAMKVMNEIKAELSGEIVDILVENGEPVEFGQPLFLVKP